GRERHRPRRAAGARASKHATVRPSGVPGAVCAPAAPTTPTAQFNRSVRSRCPFAMNWNLPFPSQRQPVIARNLVATSQPLAAQAGAAAFARGGNAIDAALAAAITLTVVEPTMNGIG